MWPECYAHFGYMNKRSVWEKARHGESDERWNMQKKHLANRKTIIQRENQKVNGAGQETKNYDGNQIIINSLCIC